MLDWWLFWYYLLIVLWYRCLPGITFACVGYSFAAYCVCLFYFACVIRFCATCLVVPAFVFCMIVCCLLVLG